MIGTAVGFYYSGSGAVTDMVRECQNVYVNNNFEIRLAHDPDGLSDLEYYLINNPNRHNGSTAIKRFMRATDKLDHIFLINRYKKYVDPCFQTHTNTYLKEIIYMNYPGFYHYDIWEKGKLVYLINAFIKKMSGGRKSVLGSKEMNYFGVIDEKIFLDATRRYTTKVLNALNKKKRKDIFFEQLIPPSNFKRYLRYFNDMRVVIVDRDPRDIYFLGKYILKDKIMPKNIYDYCKWYKWTREIAYKNEFPKQVIKIQFEDMIYKYEETRNKIFDHLELNKKNHKNKLRFFDPDISINNTQVWNRYPKLKNEADEIYKMLKPYCYHFPYKLKTSDKNMVFDMF